MSAAGQGPAPDDPTALVRPVVRALGHYTLPPRPHRVKVNQNENPFELPAEFKAEVLAAMSAAPWGRYPDFTPTGLLERLAARAGWTPDGVLAGNGSNELLSVLFQATVEPGATVVLAVPTFSLYPTMIRVAGGEVCPVPLVPAGPGPGDGLVFDVDALVASARASAARLVVVCSPNNPTGSFLPEAGVLRLLEETDGLVVVDEAYHEFAPWNAGGLLARHPRLVLLRTFSKALALAGLRVGYLLADPRLARELDKVRLPYNLSRFSTIAASAALDRYDELLAPRTARLLALRAGLAREIAAIPGFWPWPSAANFLCVRSERPPREVLATLDARGVLARDVSGQPLLAGCLRVSVGDELENAEVVAGMRE